MASTAISAISSSTFRKDAEANFLDVGEGLQEAQKPFGREIERSQLLDAFQEISENGTSKTVVVHGPSGCGKTFLVDSLRTIVCQRDGYLTSGKYFQNSGMQEPYSALMAVFSDLCDLIAQSNDFEDRKPTIQRLLGLDGHLLSKAVSNLSIFLEDLEEETEISSELAFTKFKIACKTFLHAMTCRAHPTVLVIDDIQWMDEGSMALLDMLLRDCGLQSLLVVLIYREEEPGMALELLHGKEYIDIGLNDLNCSDVHELLSIFWDVAISDLPEGLGELVFRRTMGNPFYIVAFTEMLKEDHLLAPSTSQGKENIRNFDVETLRRSTQLPDTLAGVLLWKAQRLPEEIQEILKIASLLGFHFRVTIVTHVLNALEQVESPRHEKSRNSITGGCKLEDTIVASLNVAASLGIVKKTSEGYQFSHDKVQASFQEMADEVSTEQLHHMIGTAFLAFGDEESMYHAAVHFNYVKGLITTPEDQMKMAKLNVEAFKYCRRRSAFIAALNLLEMGTMYMTQNRMWTEHYELALEITNARAKMELVVGKFEACRISIRTILHNATCLEDKVDSLVASSEVCFAQSKLRESIDKSRRALETLGIKVPFCVTMRLLASKLHKVRRLLRNKTDEYLLGLPLMTSKIEIAMVKLLTKASGNSSMEGEKQQGSYLGLMAMELTLEEGLSAYSPCAFAMYAVLECSSANYDLAYRFAQLTLALIDRLKCRHTESYALTIITTWVLHWREPLTDTVKYADRALSSSLETGDINPGTILSIFIRIRTGENLVKLEEMCCSLRTKLLDLKQDGAVRWLAPPFQYVLNLQGRPTSYWRELTELTGDAMNEGEYLRAAIHSRASTALQILWVHKLQVAYHFHDLSTAASTILKLANVLKKRLSSSYMIVQFFGSLIFF